LLDLHPELIASSVIEQASQMVPMFTMALLSENIV
jgi:hypothetical protein